MRNERIPFNLSYFQSISKHLVILGTTNKNTNLKIIRVFMCFLHFGTIDNPQYNLEKSNNTYESSYLQKTMRHSLSLLMGQVKPFWHLFPQNENGQTMRRNCRITSNVQILRRKQHVTWERVDLPKPGFRSMTSQRWVLSVCGTSKPIKILDENELFPYRGAR